MPVDFPPVANNIEKSEAYKIQMERFKQAESQGFYYEAIFILYAMLEDRLAAFLFHAGVVNSTRLKFTSNKKVRPQLNEILLIEKGHKYRLKNLSSKVSVIKQILVWSDTFQPDESAADYRALLARQIKRISGKDDFLLTLENIVAWSQARNELVHALLNKTPENLETKLHTLTTEGHIYSRKMDNFVRAFKTHNPIRKHFNIQ